MPANVKPIFPVAPILGIATLTAPAAITARTNIVGTTGLVSLTPASTNGKRVDRISVKSKGTSVAGLLSIWLYDGTTSFLHEEIVIAAITPSTTVASFSTYADYTTMILQPTYRLYVSATVSQDLNIVAHGGDY